jgi:hypothetical protein
MTFVNEVTAYLENKPGRLAKICSALAHEKINIQALCVMDTPDRSVLRLVTDDVEPTRRVLTATGTEAEFREVVAVEMDNRPGSLAKILERLAAEHINIDYAYVAPSAVSGKAVGIFHMSTPKRAIQILADSASNGGDRDSGRRPLHSR